MKDFAAKILSVIDQIKGSGNYVTKGSCPIVIPGLVVGNAPEISFPINSEQIEVLIKQAHKAPFGKGSKTIVDTNVRSVWEIDAGKISFLNPAWHTLIALILNKVKEGLGIAENEVAASLYKLLIYQKDDFFVAHKDSEKEKGMFGTLIVGLPSKHNGGELHVRFDGKEEMIDFAGPIDNYEIPFAAFYADCEHEINKVTSGFRICLTYNLIQNDANQQLQLEESKNYVRQIETLLKQNTAGGPLVILLNHQYTPENFSLVSLKHNDQHKAEVLLRAAENAGYFAKLGLLTCYQMGNMEGDFYYENRGSAGSDGEMGEVFEEYISVVNWAEDGLPDLGRLAIPEDEIIRGFDLKEDEPIAIEEEGYMGNYGMTIEYWYHYGAVVLWKKEEHFKIISQQALDVKLTWLGYYASKVCNEAEVAFIKNTFEEITATDISDYWIKNSDFSIVAELLVKLNDKSYVQSNKCVDLLIRLFDKINTNHWESLVENYGLPAFEQVFLKAADHIKSVKHLLELFNQLSDKMNKEYDKFIISALDNLPLHLSGLSFIKEDNIAPELSIVSNIISLSRYKNDDSIWIKRIIESFTSVLTRSFVNNVLAEALLLNGDNRKLNAVAEVLKICKRDLKIRIDNKPVPPKNWTRDLPAEFGNKNMLTIISAFILSPTEESFDYRAKENLRNEMESSLVKSKTDVDTQTIRKGSPYTLRLIKNRASYLGLYKKWEEDVEYLKKLESMFGN